MRQITEIMEMIMYIIQTGSAQQYWQGIIKMQRELLRPIELGFMDNGTGKHQSNTVYSTKGISPVITTIHGGTQQIKILEEKKQ